MYYYKNHKGTHNFIIIYLTFFQWNGFKNYIQYAFSHWFYNFRSTMQEQDTYMHIQHIQEAQGSDNNFISKETNILLWAIGVAFQLR